MAKIIPSDRILNLTGLGVEVEVPEGYYYIAVDDDGSCYAYDEGKPNYDVSFKCWQACWDLFQGSRYICQIEFESEEERELCKTTVWRWE